MEKGDFVFGNIENIEIKHITLSVRSNVRKEKRKDHVIVFRTAGSGIFVFDDKTIESPAGSLVFIPEGSTYELKVTSSPCISVGIRFKADILEPVPKAYSTEGFEDAHKFISKGAKLWRKGDVASKLRCTAMFYNLIAFLIEEEELDCSDNRKHELIAPALEYLNEHIFEVSFSVDALAEMCKISPSYFRRIFRSQFKMSPGKYIEKKRMELANSIIERGDFENIYEVSERVGYNDPLYFSKVFKKRFGISPSYRK